MINIMNIDEIRTYLTENGSNPDVKTYLDGLRRLPAKDLDGFFNSDEDAHKWLQSHTDAKVTRGIETWRANNLQKLLDEEMSKRYPAETEEQKRLKALESELAQERAERIKEKQRNKALAYATTKALPVDLVDYFVALQDDETDANLSRFEAVWHAALQAAVEAKIKGTGRTPAPGTPDPSPKIFTEEDMAAMSDEEFAKNYDAILRSRK